MSIFLDSVASSLLFYAKILLTDWLLLFVSQPLSILSDVLTSGYYLFYLRLRLPRTLLPPTLLLNFQLSRRNSLPVTSSLVCLHLTTSAPGYASIDNNCAIIAHQYLPRWSTYIEQTCERGSDNRARICFLLQSTKESRQDLLPSSRMIGLVQAQHKPTRQPAEDELIIWVHDEHTT